MTATFFRMRLKNQSTGDEIVVDHHADGSITAVGEGAHLLKTDMFPISRRVLHADNTFYEIVGDVEIRRG